MTDTYFCLLLCCGFSLVLSYELIFTNDFAVEIDGNDDVASLVAETHGFKVMKRMKHLNGVYRFTHSSSPSRSRRSITDIVALLKSDPNVKYVEQQKVLVRTKRRHTLTGREHKTSHQSSDVKSEMNDPYFNQQWYLGSRDTQRKNLKSSGNYLNVPLAWENKFTGQDVVITILDDGIDYEHPDLKKNYDPEASGDLTDKSDTKNDPMPNKTDGVNNHGTRCAGEIAAAANNGICGVGVAYNAKIGGIRMLDGLITDLLEAEAVTYNNDHIDIYSASWGPPDDGKTIDGPHRYCSRAIEHGIDKGRQGKGSIYVWAAGNGGDAGDYCSFDGYASNIHVISIGSVSYDGLSSSFSEACPSVLAVVFTGGGHGKPGDKVYDGHLKENVVTTDLNGKCTTEFQGTSSAAPLAAGCVALALEANENLSWRDVQNLIVRTARIPNDQQAGWMVNGAGYHVHHRFGFGALDCAKMVEMAQQWDHVGPAEKCLIKSDNPSIDIAAYTEQHQSIHVKECGSSNSHVEHVQVRLQVTHERRGDLSVILQSPAGTRSVLVATRPLDDSTEGINFTFSTVHHWGERASGTWTLFIEDSPSQKVLGKRGRLMSWELILQTTSSSSSANDNRNSRAYMADVEEIQEIMKREILSSSEVNIQAKGYKQTEQTNDIEDIDIKDIELLRQMLQAEPPLNDDASYERHKRKYASHNKHQRTEETDLTELIQDVEDFIDKLEH